MIKLSDFQCSASVRAIMTTMLAVGGIACSRVSRAVRHEPPLVNTVVAQSALTSFVGNFTRNGEVLGDTALYNFTVSPTSIRCNHSNHSQDWHEHAYSVGYARADEILLLAADGQLKIHRDAATGHYNPEAGGICPWGIDGSYSFQASGSPSGVKLALRESVTQTRDHSTGSLNETVQLPGGTFTLRDARRGTWSSDNQTIHVLEFRISVQNTSQAVEDMSLPEKLNDIIPNNGFLSVECGPDNEPASGGSNPNNSNHRQPAFDRGVYTVFGGHSAMAVAPGTSRDGWFTLLMRSRTNGRCRLHFDLMGLGGGIVDYTVLN
jgi:hypothetical protein